MTLEQLSIKLMQKIPIFRGLNETECRQLAETITTKEFAGGDFVIEQGKNCQNLWVLLEGTCEVVRQPTGASLADPPTSRGPANDLASNAKPLILAKLEPYSHFGEMSFFHPAPHSAHVVARSPVRLLCMARSDYDDLIQEGVTAAYKLAYNSVQGLADRLRKMDERVIEFASHNCQPDDQPPPAHEWSAFREKLFDGWNL